MRGEAHPQPALFSYVSLEERVPRDHPLRKMRTLVDAVLATMDADFTAVYSVRGRPSIPLEFLRRALLIQILYTVRSERQLVEQIDFDLLFRWFVGLSIDERVWDHSSFSHNRERLCYLGHALMENRNGLVVDLETAEANGRAEREAAAKMLTRIAPRAKSLGADKNYDTAALVATCRRHKVAAHVAAKKSGSAIDGRTTRHETYRVSMRMRKRIEEIFGWLQTVGGLRKSRHMGRAKLAGQMLLGCAAYNLVRIGSLSGWSSIPFRQLSMTWHKADLLPSLLAKTILFSGSAEGLTLAATESSP